MDFIATVLGLQLPTLKARDCLREHFLAAQPLSSSSVEGKKIVWDKWQVTPGKAECDDDETTLSTVSSDDDSDDSLSSDSSHSVSFAAPLVTEVFLRPYTHPKEREELYYREADFRRFRMDYRREIQCPRMRPSVTFSSSVVSQVHALPEVENKDEVYYSSAELKQFLEDFILSLDAKQSL